MATLPNPESPAPLIVDLAIGLVVLSGVALALKVGLATALLWPIGTVAAYLAIAAVVYRAWPERQAFGWANRVTLVRAAVVALLLGALALPDLVANHGLLLAALALAAIVLDGLDGWIARVSSGTTDFGARFDMEVDALLILALSIAVVMADQGAWWVISIGAMRYAFLAAGRVMPWLTRDLPDSAWRKGICVAQGIVLAAALLPWLSPPMTDVLLAAALAALAASFARDIVWLKRVRDREGDGRDG